MKDFIFFIFIVCSFSFTAATRQSPPYIPTRPGIILEYLTDNLQTHRKIYSYRTIQAIETSDTVSKIHYDVCLTNKKKSLLVPSIGLTAFQHKEGIYFYEWDPGLLTSSEQVTITGKGTYLPSALQIGQRLEDGDLLLGQPEVKVRICISRRKVTAQETIKVPAGVYTCYKIEEIHETTSFGMLERTLVHNWYSPGIGMVKSETYNTAGQKIGYRKLLSIRKDHNE